MWQQAKAEAEVGAEGEAAALKRQGSIAKALRLTPVQCQTLAWIRERQLKKVAALGQARRNLNMQVRQQPFMQSRVSICLCLWSSDICQAFKARIPVCRGFTNPPSHLLITRRRARPILTHMVWYTHILMHSHVMRTGDVADAALAAPDSGRHGGATWRPVAGKRRGASRGG